MKQKITAHYLDKDHLDEEFDWDIVGGALHDYFLKTKVVRVNDVLEVIKSHCVPKKAWEHERVLVKGYESAAKDYLDKLKEAEEEIRLYELIGGETFKDHAKDKKAFLEAEKKLEKVKKEIISWQEAHRKNGFNPPKHLDDILEFLTTP